MSATDMPEACQETAKVFRNFVEARTKQLAEEARKAEAARKNQELADGYRSMRKPTNRA